MEAKKNILVLTGSPRRGGNSSHMADAFVEGAEKNGHTLLRFDTGRLKIGGCMACKKCFSKGTACVFKDDFNTLAPHIEHADMLVLVTPLYWYSFPAQLKAVIDKMYSLFIAERPVKIKQCLMLVCGETDVLTDFDGIVRSYEEIAKLMEWENCGVKIVPAVNEVGDILQTNSLKEIKELAALV